MNQEYSERFNRVLAYIDKHLDEELSVERLSRVAHFSKFHFHRQFGDYVGISVARYTQLMRLKRASYQLVFTEQKRIIEIALAAGFENPESFSRAFKLAFGQTPSQFRKQPAWQPWVERYRIPARMRTPPMDVQIVDFPHTPIAVLEHRGPVDLLNDSVRRFIDWRKQTGLSPVRSSRTFGIAYDDPNTTAPERFRFDICGSVREDVPENAHGIVNKAIPAGRCARVQLLGPHDQIDTCAYFLYRDWLPDSGEELRDFPLFFHYINLMPDTPEHELITDVYLPLMPRSMQDLGRQG